MPEPSQDWRLSQIERRVERLEPVVTEVAVLKRDMENLTAAIRGNTTATRSVAEAMEKAQLEPLTRARNMRSQLVIVLVGALVGGGLAILATVIAGN